MDEKGTFAVSYFQSFKANTKLNFRAMKTNENHYVINNILTFGQNRKIIMKIGSFSA